MHSRNRNAHPVQIVFVEAQRLRLREDGLFGAIHTFQCGLQHLFQGVRLRTLRSAIKQ